MEYRHPAIKAAVCRYYHHARSLGAFRAADCLRMAREAAALDYAPRDTGMHCVWHEVMPDGSNKLSLTAQVRVF